MTVLKVSHQITVLFDQSDVNRTLYTHTHTPILLRELWKRNYNSKCCKGCGAISLIFRDK
jgi:hypothetical protein